MQLREDLCWHTVHVREHVTNNLMASLIKYMEPPSSECGCIHSRNPCSRQCHGLFYDCLPAQEQRHGLTPSLRSHATFEPSRRAKCDTAATIILFPSSCYYYPLLATIPLLRCCYCCYSFTPSRDLASRPSDSPRKNGNAPAGRTAQCSDEPMMERRYV